LPPAGRTLLDDDLAIHALLQTQVDALEKTIVADNAANPLAVRLQTLPGVGKILGKRPVGVPLFETSRGE
jgi:hypothetical protein